MDEFRRVLAIHLKETLDFLLDTFISTSLGEEYWEIYQKRLERDECPPSGSIVQLYSLCLWKAQLHVQAVLRGNKQDNVHSMGTHARVVVECATEAKLMSQNIRGDTRALGYLISSIDWQTHRVMSQMGMQVSDPEERRRDRAERCANQLDGVRSIRANIMDRVGILSGGRESYKILSNNFCHTSADSFEGPPFVGGLSSEAGPFLDFACIGALCHTIFATHSLLFAFGLVELISDDDSKVYDDTEQLVKRMDEDCGPYMPMFLRTAKLIGALGNEEIW